MNRDASEIATLASDGRLRHWSSTEGQFIREQTLSETPILVAALSRDAQHAAYQTIDNETYLWRAAANRSERVTTAIPTVSLCFSAQARFLAVAGGDRGIQLWNVAPLSRQAALIGHTQPVAGMTFSDDERTLFSGSGGGLFDAGEVKLWDVSAAQAHATLPNCGAPISVDPQGQMLVTTDRAGRKLSLWHAARYDSRPR